MAVIHYGVGRHMPTLSPGQLTNIAKVSLRHPPLPNPLSNAEGPDRDSTC